MIYITGATGFIGERLTRRLLERGEQVRCLVRSPDRAAKLTALGAQLVQGDVADEEAHLEGLRDEHLAYHLAAIYDIGIVDRRALDRANIEGTRAFLSAIVKAGTQRAVYVSSTVALGPSHDRAAEPRDAYAGPYPTHYHRTKAEAHRLARAAQQRGTPLVVVCPAYVYGPGDNGPGGRFLSDILHRRLPGLPNNPTTYSYVHVDDVVDGLIAAGDRGRTGEVYILSGDAATLNDFAARAAKLGGTKPPFLRFPTVMVSVTGRVLDWIARLTGLRFPITREAADVGAAGEWLHAHARASRDLGYMPRTLDQGLPETVASWS